MRKRSNSDAPRARVLPSPRPRGRLARGLLAGSIGLAISSAAAVAGAQTITVDASDSVSGNPRFWSTCVGTGTASLTLRADLQTHYKLAKRELGMLRVRGHGLLNDDMGIFHWSGGGAQPTYDWTKFDTYLAAIDAAGMRPIIELSFMPTDLASQGNDRNPPSDLNVYSDMIEAVVQHAIDLYGEEDVIKWYWEVWNEPNYEGFWTGTMDDYYEMYDAAAAGATAALPNILIGGPVTTQGSVTQMTDFLAHVENTGSRVTFLSSHAYPGGAGDSASASFGVSDNDGRVGVIRDAGFDPATFPSFNSEWNTAYTGQGGNTTPNNVSMDNHVNAPFILKSVKLLADQVEGDTPPLDVFSYWVISDVFGEYGSDAGSYIESQGGGTLPFGSVFGLMTYQGVRKAGYNAFRMLNYLGDQRLSVSGGSGNADGVDAMATVSADGTAVAVIVFNYYATINTTGSDSVTLSVTNLPFAGQPVFVTKFGIDEDHSSPYGVWQSQGSPNNPSEAEWQAMREAQHLALLEPVSSITAESSYSASLELPRQGAAMIILSTQRPVTGRDAFVELEAEDYDGQSGATKQDSDDASMGQSVALGDGGQLYFAQVDFSDAGAEGVDLRVDAQGSATLELHADSATGTLLGSCAITATGGEWATQTCAITPTMGVHSLYVVAAGAVRVNWLKFTGEGGTVDGGVGTSSTSTTGAGGAATTTGSDGTAATGGSVTTTAGTVTGTGGAATTAGAATGSVGMTGAVGTTGVDGSSFGTSTSAGLDTTGGANPDSATDADSGGCGCRIASGRSPAGSLVLLGFVALGLLRRAPRISASARRYLLRRPFSEPSR